MTSRFRTSSGGRRWLAGAGAAAAALTLAASATAAAASPGAPARAAAPRAGQPAGAAPAGRLPAAGRLGARPACGTPAPRYAACQVMVDTGVHWDGHAWATGRAPAARPRTSPPATVPAASPSAPLAPYMAADLQSAYNLPSALLGARQTIAIVDAYDDPTAAADLAAYRQANNLPACDADFPCFTKVNQDGQQGNYPLANASWAAEESLDLDMASAICPNCTIILVEADDNSLASLAAAENTAAELGANVISNSYGGAEYPGETAIAQDYDHPGIAITASAGDHGFEPAGSQVPAAFASVTAVGGTTLYRDATARGWSETAWYSFTPAGQGQQPGTNLAAGSGCSAYIPKPAWQHDPLCGTRTTADVSAVADPDTPVAVYDSGDGGWLAAGGTSVASPIIAGVYALAGNAATIGPGASWLYAHRRDLSDVTGMAGTTGSGDCGGSYLCASGPGYDGPTGWGTPDGIGAF